MIQCPSCRRHHYADAADCPFCRSKSTLPMGKTLAAAVTTFVLAACYGTVDGGTKTGDSGTDTGETLPTTATTTTN